MLRRRWRRLLVRQAVDAHEARDEAGRPGRLGLGRRRGGLGGPALHAARPAGEGVEHRLDLHANLQDRQRSVAISN